MPNKKFLLAALVAISGFLFAPRPASAADQEKVLYAFDGGADGISPSGTLVFDAVGNLYGTTVNGGDYRCELYMGCGTVFKLGVGLPPFLETLPAFGVVGAPITILGTNLTGATSVTFNGAAATFTVVSNTEISTTVPTGATTGKVQVDTPNGTLSSNGPFRVLP